MTYRSRIANRRVALGCAALVAATLVACSDQATAPSGAGLSRPSASNDKFNLASATSTLEWEATARSLVASHAMAPIAAGRMLALLGVGQYGAVVAADGGDVPVDGGRALYEARRGAVAGASASILSYIFPDAAAALENQVTTDGAEGPGNTHPHFTRGVATGREMGARMVAWGSTDGFSVPWNGLPFADPLGGGWIGAAGAPAGFQFPKMRPYYLTSQNQFRPPPPPVRGSAEFLANLDAVRTAALNRTTADIALANFWNLSNGTITALGYWDERAADYITAGGLDERAASHVFALVNSTALDAIIGCWDAKYYYMYLRPSMADPSITRPPGLPGFPYNLPNHPSYPSGHSCVSASAARVLASLFPANAATLADQVAAAGRSRVIGGIHYPVDIVAGQALGRAVADWAMAYDQQPGGLLAALDTH
jgi:membrane-associated phospholipid phosphatase